MGLIVVYLFMHPLFFIVACIGILVLISMWFIFKKEGQPGWASLVPFYNILILLRTIRKPYWWIFMS